MPTKIDRINNAYSQMRISGLTVDPSPEDISLALNRLEEMMAELETNRNMCVSYNFELEPDANSPTGVSKNHWNMMACNLAIRCIPDFNKAPQLLISGASQSLEGSIGYVMAQNAREIQPSRRMPRGSGNTRYGNRWQRFSNPAELPPNECATNKIVLEDINDYTESFDAYLKDETIASFTTVADSGLTLLSSSNDDPLISYRVEAVENTTNGVWQQVKIVVTTSSGRVETRRISFEITSNETVGSN